MNQPPTRSLVLPVAGELSSAALLVFAVCGALYLLLTGVGQGEDLLRHVKDDLSRFFFFSLSLATLSAGAHALFWDRLRTIEGLPLEWRFGLASLSLAAPAALVVAGRRAAPDSAFLDFFLALTAAMPVLGSWMYFSDTESDSRALIVGGSHALLGCLLAAAAWTPDVAGWVAGALPLAVVVAGAVLWGVSWLLHRRRLVWLAMFMVVVLAMSRGEFGRRPVRVLAVAPAVRPDATTHARMWLEARRREIDASASYPVVVVTADGGGIRAGYWSATLLAALTDADPGLGARIFAISGVSGGAVGAAVYASLVADAAPPGSWRSRVRQVLDVDLLGPQVAAMLFRDPWISIGCGLSRILCPTQGVDRAVALETTLEDRWRASQRSDWMTRSLTDMWADQRRLRVPSLLLNSSLSARPAARIASNLSVAQGFGQDADLISQLPAGQSLRLSTAAILSARFPIVSPEALLPGVGTATVRRTLVDGGYFDNSGGAAAAPVVNALVQAAEDMGLPQVKPMALVITNDVGPLRTDLALSQRLCGADQAARAAEDLPTGFGQLLTSPLATLDGARANAAESWRAGFTGVVRKAGGEVWPLSLFQCDADRGFEVPLGWALSRTSLDYLDRKVDALLQTGQPARRALEGTRVIAREPGTGGSNAR